MDQVGDPVAFRLRRLEQPYVDEPLECVADVPAGRVELAGDDGCVDGRGWERAELAEDPRCGRIVRGQYVVGRRQGVPNAQVLEGQDVQPAPRVGQLVGEQTDRPGRPAGKACGGDPERERQAVAELYEMPRGRRLGRHPVIAEYRGQCGGAGLG